MSNTLVLPSLLFVGFIVCIANSADTTTTVTTVAGSTASTASGATTTTTASQTTATTPQPTTGVPQFLPCIDKIDCTPNAGECGLPAFKPLLYNYCRKTCNFCNECIDADDRCKYWVPNKFCTNAFYANITDECAKSCNKCTG